MAKSKYTNTKFTKKIKELIDEEQRNGITYKILEKRIGVPQASLNEYYNGERVASAENLVKIAEYFGCSIDSLLGIDRQGTVDDVCNYLGVNYRTAVGLKDNIDVIIGNIEEHNDIGIDESVMLSLLETMMTFDDCFLDWLLRMVWKIRDSKDMDIYMSSPGFDNEFRYRRSPIEAKLYIEYLASHTFIKYLDEIAEAHGSQFTEKDIESIQSAKTTKDLLLQMHTYDSTAMNQKIYREFANIFLYENKDDEQIKSMLKQR